MAVSPQSASNPMIGQRLANKLAYSLNNTQLQLTFVHKSGEPPLNTWLVPADTGEFYANEVGWQDELQVTVTHKLALLPGPGRLLFSQAASPSGAGPGEQRYSTTECRSVYVHADRLGQLGQRRRKVGAVVCQT